MTVESQRINDLAILITGRQQFILAVHLRLASFFYSNQLIDMFAYDVPTTTAPLAQTQKITTSAITQPVAVTYNALVHVFHLLHLHRRLFTFVLNTIGQQFRVSMYGQIRNWTKSFDDLYKNAWWAERETGELFGIDFIGKSDFRNLLLQYGMTDHPMQKFFPTIGLAEVVYYQLIDSVIKVPLALQY